MVAQMVQNSVFVDIHVQSYLRSVLSNLYPVLSYLCSVLSCLYSVLSYLYSVLP